MNCSLNQLKTLIWKNYLTIKKDTRSLFVMIISIAFLIFIGVIQAVMYKRDTSLFISYDRTNVKNVKETFQNSLLPIHGDQYYLGFIYPNSFKESQALTDLVMQNEIFDDLTVTPKIFESESLLEDFIKNDSEKDQLLAGIVFQENVSQYTIRLPHERVPDPSLNSKLLYFASNETLYNDYTNYFVPIQSAVDQAILQYKTKQPIHLSANFGGLSIPQFINNDEFDSSGVFYYYTFLYIFFAILSLSLYIVDEKKQGLKKILFINGITSLPYYFSWALIYTSFFIVVYFIIFVVEILVKVSIWMALLRFVASCLLVIGFNLMLILITIFFKKNAQACYQLCSMVGVLWIFMAYIYKYIKNIVVLDYFIIVLPIVKLNSLFNKNLLLGISSFKDIVLNPEVIRLFLAILINLIILSVLIVVFESLLYEESESFLTRWLKRGNKKTAGPSVPASEAYQNDIENYTTHEKCMAEISDIVKTYQYSNQQKKENNETEDMDLEEGKEFNALQQVSFKVYENEIFGILGHNGAGKSTLLNIMTGLINPNSGHVYYEGEDFFKNKNKIRSVFGICPQNDGLFERLSVEENIKIFAGIKNIKIDVDKVLREVDLIDKKNEIVNLLSGGQKKKLCVAIALLGNPKYVFLDEPTTGLDPLSRRNMWDLLKKNKDGKVIFLTTHYMDEADVLTDRKLILHKGVIRCLGSSMYLKKHFNIMYNLQIETENYDEARSIVLKHIPEAIENKLPKEEQHYDQVSVYTFKLPMEAVPKFSNLINELEDAIEQSKTIKKFSISLPSLEELFIRLELYKDHSEEDTLDESTHGLPSSDDHVILVDKNATLPDGNYENHQVSDSDKISTLLKLRCKLYLKNKDLYLNAIVTPVLLILIMYIFSKFVFNKDIVEYPTLELSYPKLYNSTLWNYDDQPSNLPSEMFETTFGKDSSNHYEINTLDGLDNVKEYAFSMNGSSNDTNYTIDVYSNKLMVHASPSILNGISNTILQSYRTDDSITVYSHPLPYQDYTNSITFYIYFFMIFSMLIAIGLSSFGMTMIHERVTGLKKQLQLNQVSSKCYWISCTILDVVLVGLLYLLVIGIGLIFQFEPLLHSLSLMAILLIAVVSALGSLLVQYTIGLFFNKEHIAKETIQFIHLGLFILGFILFFIFNRNPSEATDLLGRDGKPYVAIASLLYPPLGFALGFYLIIKLNALHKDSGVALTLDYYKNPNNGFILILGATLLSIVLYYVVLTRLDKKLNENKKADGHAKAQIVANNEALLKENEDLYRELESIKSQKERFPLSVLHVTKEFPQTVHSKALKNKIKNQKHYEYGELHPSKYEVSQIVKTIIEDVSFGVREKECFGLLGPNGVGKSTLLNTITSTFTPTSGEVFFSGVPSAQSTEVVGYCSQEDILWEELTVLEHVMLYLKLRGTPASLIKEYALQYLRYCQIDEYKNQRVAKLSGGTKRKLCILLAVCGSPKQIILDEPTSGIDAATRLFIWNMIKELKDHQHSSILMTTHSMEEAQELCDRLTILINGRLVCLGSPEYLRLKYGKSYILEVQTLQPDAVQDRLFGPTGPFHSCPYKMESVTNDRFKYQIELDRGVGKLFEILEDAKHQQLISDYTISQSNLEQVFIDFAKQFNKKKKKKTFFFFL